MSVETVARRYATALADVVIKTGETNSVKTELKTWEEMISSNSQLLQAFSNPSIAQENKEKVLENLIEKTKPTKTTANFLRDFTAKQPTDRNQRNQRTFRQRSRRTKRHSFRANHIGASDFGRVKKRN